MARFAIVGSSGILLNLGFFLIAKGFLENTHPTNLQMLLAASLIGDEVSLLYNFFFNQLWTFNLKNFPFKKLLKFHAIALPGILINNVAFTVSYMIGMFYLVAKLAGILVASLFNYLFNIQWTEREKI